jgi:hypothetical protein
VSSRSRSMVGLLPIVEFGCRGNFAFLLFFVSCTFCLPLVSCRLSDLLYRRALLVGPSSSGWYRPFSWLHLQVSDYLAFLLDSGGVLTSLEAVPFFARSWEESPS